MKDNEIKNMMDEEKIENKDINIDISEEEKIQNNEHSEHNKEKFKKEDDKIKVKRVEDELFEKINKEDKEKIIHEYIKLLKENEKAKKHIKDKEIETNEYLDKYRRALAEMENLRKRTVLEKQDALKYANFNIISDLLVVLDDFQRAIDSAKADEKMELKHFIEGVDMIEKQFADLLFKKYGVIRFCEINDEFDPKIHLAMMAEQGEYENEKVLEVFRKGYLLHDRVIRPAEVKIGKPKE